MSVVFLQLQGKYSSRYSNLWGGKGKEEPAELKHGGQRGPILVIDPGKFAWTFTNSFGFYKHQVASKQYVGKSGKHYMHVC